MTTEDQGKQMQSGMAGMWGYHEDTKAIGSGEVDRQTDYQSILCIMLRNMDFVDKSKYF